jgi:seryl-tRNA synthetase
LSNPNTLQAKENADDLVAKKKEIDAQVEAKRKQAKEHEAAMRVKASTAGNIVGTAVPVSNTEVSHPCIAFSESSPPRTASQDDNQVIRTWHPDGPNGTFEKKSGILAHHEVLLRLDAMDLDRGDLFFISIPSSQYSTTRVQAQKSPAIVATSSQTMVSTSTRL